MKELKRIFIVELVVFWAIYVLLVWLFYSMFGKPIDFFSVIFGVILAFVFAAINLLTIYSLLKAQLKFLESDDRNMLAFGNKVEKVFTVNRNDFSFEVIKYKIKEQYHIVLYDDVEQYLIKFHSGISLFSWGVGGTVVYDAVTKTMTVTCFPINSYDTKALKSTQAVVDKVESLIV